jgi:hypothetical protein
MGLMNFFRKEVPSEQQPTAVEYVEWLLKYMVRTSHVELTLDSRRALPGSNTSEQGEAPPCLPDVRAVINRFKILSGVNPMTKQSAATGIVFQRPRTHDTVFVSTQFQEDTEKSVCSIRLQFRVNKVS